MNSFYSLDEYYNNNSNLYVLGFLEFVNSIFKTSMNALFILFVMFILVMFIRYSFKVYI